MLGAAVMVPVSAFAHRSFPTRPLFCATTLLLAIGSVIGALAQDFAVLLAGRVVQVLGAGMLIPIGMNITLEVAPREKLGACMGIMGAMTTLGPSSSVILAGLILAVSPWQMLLWTFAGLSALSKLTYEQNPHGVTIMSTGFQVAACVGSSVFTGIYAAVTAAGVAAGAGYAATATQAMGVTGALVGAVGAAGLVCALVIRRMAARHPSESDGSWEHAAAE